MNKTVILSGFSAILIAVLILGCRMSGSNDDKKIVDMAASPPGSFYCEAQTVILLASNGTIYYTLDGSDPAEGSSVYDAPLHILENTTLKFILVNAKGNQSDVVTEIYEIDLSPENLDYLIITADGLFVEAQAIREYRESTCHNAGLLTMSEIIEGMEAGPIEDEIKSRISSLYSERDPERPFFVLLVGDADASSSLNPELVPTAVVNIAGEDVISDNWYADVVGNDSVPDLAIGRLPFRNSAEVSLYLDKLIDYEGIYLPGEWNRRLSFFAGDPGFGDTVDDIIEQVAMLALDLLPYNYNLNMTYGNDGSAYFYVPEEFSDKVYERFNEGALAMTYLGHASKSGLYSVMGEPSFDTGNLDALNPEGRAPIFNIIACSAGKFTGTTDSLSERIIKDDNGMIAIFSSTEVSHPAINALLAIDMGEVVFENQPKTFGEGLIEVKDGIVNGEGEELHDLVVSLLMYIEEVTEEEVSDMMVSHNHMYTLFGDPALVLPFPRGNIDLALNGSEYQAGDTVSVAGMADISFNGQATVSLEVVRPVLAYPVETIDWGDPDVNDVIRQNYVNANNKILESHNVQVVSGAFTTEFSLSGTLDSGTYYIKAYAYTDSTDAVGSTPFTLMP
jgi:Peptidase family C25/Chitobiase/beta-hexosaminidase C-terminal domain